MSTGETFVNIMWDVLSTYHPSVQQAVAHTAAASMGDAMHRLAATEWRALGADALPIIETFRAEIMTSVTSRVGTEDDVVNQCCALMDARLMMCAGSRHWLEHNAPAFDLTPDFTHAVAHTDFGDSGEDPAPLPFPAFMLNLPLPSPMGDLRAHRLMVVPNILYQRGPGVVDPDTSVILAETTHVADDGIRHPVPIAVFSRSAPMSTITAPQLNLNWYTVGGGVVIGDASSAACRRLFGNVVTYISAHGGPPKQKASGGDMPVERTHKDRPLFRVGRPVRLDREIREALGASASGGASFTVTSRFVVRGHWRNQPVGQGRQGRRRTWIMPHWKGPPLAEALARTYVVD